MGGKSSEMRRLAGGERLATAPAIVRCGWHQIRFGRRPCANARGHSEGKMCECTFTLALPIRGPPGRSTGALARPAGLDGGALRGPQRGPRRPPAAGSLDSFSRAPVLTPCDVKSSWAARSPRRPRAPLPSVLEAKNPLQLLTPLARVRPHHVRCKKFCGPVPGRQRQANHGPLQAHENRDEGHHEPQRAQGGSQARRASTSATSGFRGVLGASGRNRAATGQSVTKRDTRSRNVTPATERNRRRPRPIPPAWRINGDGWPPTGRPIGARLWPSKGSRLSWK